MAAGRCPAVPGADRDRCRGRGRIAAGPPAVGVQPGVLESGDGVVGVEAVLKRGAAADRPAQDGAEPQLVGHAVGQRRLPDPRPAGDQQWTAQIEGEIDQVDLPVVGDIRGGPAMTSEPSGGVGIVGHRGRWEFPVLIGSVQRTPGRCGGQPSDAVVRTAGTAVHPPVGRRGDRSLLHGQSIPLLPVTPGVCTTTSPGSSCPGRVPRSTGRPRATRHAAGHRAPVRRPQRCAVDAR